MYFPISFLINSDIGKNIHDARTINIDIWDQSNVSLVEKSIRESDLGINPMIEGNLIRIPIPELSEERRKEIVKIASKYSEDCRVAIRNIRREAMDKIKSLEKNKEISKDESFQFSENVQLMTDKFIEMIDTLFSDKEKDILKV